ncbi:hypothetical protein JKF63_06639 [Porcisia hertigi]|uniref:Kinesin motor domain-containing protein n=1 Tax=Porcisia hertigi TaxID=2761500 RepID=A0A836IM33_9TRYP|nr:hypothetical protein JKF63_06639 [Porcisia hertigi]
MGQRRVSVAVRVRPDTDSRHPSCVSLNHATCHVSVQEGTGANGLAGSRSYKEDFIFDEHASNRAVFEKLVLQKMRAASPEHPDTLCFLAYGHTCSGKTYSIAGNEHELGILALCVEELLRREGVVEVSMLEVYLESVNDLLANGEPRHIRRRQGPNGPVVVVQGLTTCTLTSLEEWHAASVYGMSSRRTAPTERNPRSSRSHAIFTIKSRGVRLCFVDLAGSERQTVFSPQLNKESISINKSLSRLSTVLEALSNQSAARGGTRGYVNFRDTTLTVLLQRYLTGASMTTFLACVHPSSDYYQETLSTLRYTQRLKRIHTRVTTPGEGEWSGINTSEHHVLLLDELMRLREQMKAKESTTKLVEAAHQRRITALERALADQTNSQSGTACCAMLPSLSPHRDLNATRARDTRRVAGWLLSRVLGELPGLNVGYDTYFDPYFPPSVQVIGFVSAMASLVPRNAVDEPLAFLDVGDLAMGLSMLDAGVPPFVRLHKAGCGDPSSWEGYEWDEAKNVVYVLAFFEYHPTAMSPVEVDALGMEEPLPCCGGFVTSEPLLPIATVLCVASSTTRRLKEEVLQRLIDLQSEQHEVVAERVNTGALTLPLSSSVSSYSQDSSSQSARLLDASLVRDVIASESVDSSRASSSTGDNVGPLAVKGRRQTADTSDMVTSFEESSDCSTVTKTSTDCDSHEEVHSNHLGTPKLFLRPSMTPLLAHKAEEPTALGGSTAGEVPSTQWALSPHRPSLFLQASGGAVAVVTPVNQSPPRHTSKQHHRSVGKHKAVKIQSCQGCSSM